MSAKSLGAMAREGKVSEAPACEGEGQPSQGVNTGKGGYSEGHLLGCVKVQ